MILSRFQPQSCHITSTSIYSIFSTSIYFIAATSIMTSLLFITSSLLITSLLVTSCLGQKTANEVAAALKDQELCSASIENNACVSNQLMSPEEWQAGIIMMNSSVVFRSRKNLLPLQTYLFSRPFNENFSKNCSYDFYKILQSFCVQRCSCVRNVIKILWLGSEKHSQNKSKQAGNGPSRRHI